MKNRNVCIFIANSIRGTPEYEMDCELYCPLGCVPKSERKSDTRRKAESAAEMPADEANAA